MFYGQVTKPNVDLNEELGEPYIEYQGTDKHNIKKYITKRNEDYWFNRTISTH